jgi:hypothetical protein
MVRPRWAGMEEGVQESAGAFAEKDSRPDLFFKAWAVGKRKKMKKSYVPFSRSRRT